MLSQFAGNTSVQRFFSLRRNLWRFMRVNPLESRVGMGGGGGDRMLARFGRVEAESGGYSG